MITTKITYLTNNQCALLNKYKELREQFLLYLITINS